MQNIQGKNSDEYKAKDALCNPKLKKKIEKLYLEFYWKKIGVGIVCYVEQCSTLGCSFSFLYNLLYNIWVLY